MTENPEENGVNSALKKIAKIGFAADLIIKKQRQSQKKKIQL